MYDSFRRKKRSDACWCISLWGFDAVGPAWREKRKHHALGTRPLGTGGRPRAATTTTTATTTAVSATIATTAAIYHYPERVNYCAI
eukprot:gene9451-biopygen2509